MECIREEETPSTVTYGSLGRNVAFTPLGTDALWLTTDELDEDGDRLSVILSNGILLTHPSNSEVVLVKARVVYS